jgi:hypothetical protein
MNTENKKSSKMKHALKHSLIHDKIRVHCIENVHYDGTKLGCNWSTRCSVTGD